MMVESAETTLTQRLTLGSNMNRRSSESDKSMAAGAGTQRRNKIRDEHGDGGAVVRFVLFVTESVCFVPIGVGWDVAGYQGSRKGTLIIGADCCRLCLGHCSWSWVECTVFIMQIASEKMAFIIDLIKLYDDNLEILDSCLTRILHPIQVPESDIGTHFGMLLEGMGGSDVVFNIAGEKFHAHKLVLAARSSAFRMEFFENLDDDKEEIVLTDMEPIVFKAILHFIYSDNLLEGVDFDPSSANCDLPITESLIVKVLEASDKYGLMRLKRLCTIRHITD
ncbi:hypothetical protein Droror1_Dr00022604 [Drosera rotundifolia]